MMSKKAHVFMVLAAAALPILISCVAQIAHR
jgi:hypothetical protein